MLFENEPSTFPTGQNPDSDTTGFLPAQQNPGFTATPQETGLPELTDFQKSILPRYMNHLEGNGDLAGDFAVTKLNA